MLETDTMPQLKDPSFSSNSVQVEEAKDFTPDPPKSKDVTPVPLPRSYQILPVRWGSLQREALFWAAFLSGEILVMFCLSLHSCDPK